MTYFARGSSKAINPDYCTFCGQLLDEHGINAKCNLDPRIRYVPGYKGIPGDFDYWFIITNSWMIVRDEDDKVFHLTNEDGAITDGMSFEEAVEKLKAWSKY